MRVGDLFGVQNRDEDPSEGLFRAQMRFEVQKLIKTRSAPDPHSQKLIPLNKKTTFLLKIQDVLGEHVLVVLGEWVVFSAF